MTHSPSSAVSDCVASRMSADMLRCAQALALICALGWGGISPSLLAAEEGGMALQLPAGAKQLTRRETALGSYALPVGAFSAEGIPLEQVEGHILRRTWQLQGDATVLQVMAPVRSQLQAQGYEILFQCPERQCGGFDFRFGIEVVPAPDMVVSLSDYQFLAVAKPQDAAIVDGVDTGRQVASVLVSRNGSAVYLQLIEVAPVILPPLEVAEGVETTTAPAEEAPKLGLSNHLAEAGHAVLEGLVFDTGATALGEASIIALEPLAVFLGDIPTVRILIVGHTDTVGNLEDNIALSQRRAEAVKEALVENYDIDPDRVQVIGAGFMAPIASNLTAPGREKNRRVEVVLTSRD